jgi:hypothetical protein
MAPALSLAGLSEALPTAGAAAAAAEMFARPASTYVEAAGPRPGLLVPITHPEVRSGPACCMPIANKFLSLRSSPALSVELFLEPLLRTESRRFDWREKSQAFVAPAYVIC